MRVIFEKHIWKISGISYLTDLEQTSGRRKNVARVKID
jgi:hypothetical protein